jgi:hypothetical protein
LHPGIFDQPEEKRFSIDCGKWREVGKTATVEFSKDGTFKAVDNQGMAVSGRYTLLKDGHLRCEIQQKGGAGEVVNLTISIKGDELTLTSSRDKEVEIYRTERRSQRNPSMFEKGKSYGK